MGGCAQMCKCFLILFNTLFALLGFGMVSLGLWLRFGADTKGFFNVDLKTTEFAIGVTVLIVTGVFMILVAVVGDLGACNQSKSALSVFACLLSILMIAEIAAGVMAFMWSDRVAQKLADFYVSIYAQYVNSRAEGQAVTLRLFHNAFNCCGVGGPIELFVQDTCPSSSSFIQQIQTPNCPGVIRSVFDSKAPLVMGGFLGTAGIMAWWMTDNMSTDIWARWLWTNGRWNYTEIPEHYSQDYLQAVQASSVLACIFCILGLFVFVAQLYTLPKGKRFLFTGAFQLLAWLCIVIAASIYTDIFHKDEKNGWYGASFILAWISVCLTFISCVTYFILRKKTA